MAKTIGIFGATGSYDFGDYAMLAHNIQTLNAINPEYNFIVFTISPEVTRINLLENLINRSLMKQIQIVDDNFITHVKFFHHFFRFRKFQMEHLYDKIRNGGGVQEELFDAFASLDMVLFNGGGYLQHSWHYHNIKFMIEIILAKRMNKPVFFLANSVGPMMQYDKYTREVLPMVDSIMLRDGKLYSWKLLENYDMTQVKTGADDLFFAGDAYTEYYQTKNHDDYVMIEIMFMIRRAKKGADFIINSLKNFTDWLIEKQHKKIVLINFDINDGFAKQAINKIFQASNHKESIKTFTEIHSMYEVFELYKNCSYSLSFKYHPVILSLGNSRPCAGIITDDDGYYESKLKGAFMSCELDPSKNVFHIDELTLEKLIETYQQTQNIICSPEVRSNLLTGRKEYLQEILSCLN